MDLLMKGYKWQFLAGMAALLITTLFLVACGVAPNMQTQDPPPTATVEIAIVEKITQDFIKFYESEQAADLLALYSHEAVYLNNSEPYRDVVIAELVRNSRSYIEYLFKDTKFDIKFSSHYISRDGRFVALNGTYTNIGKDGNLASIAVVIILEVNDGKIIREDWYYDNSPFY